MTITSADRLVLQHLPKGMEGAQFVRVSCLGSEPGRVTFLMNNRAGAHYTEWAVGEDGMLSLQVGRGGERGGGAANVVWAWLATGRCAGGRAGGGVKRGGGVVRVRGGGWGRLQARGKGRGGRVLRPSLVDLPTAPRCLLHGRGLRR